MYELAQCIQLAVDADLVNLYLVETEGEITKYCPDAENRCAQIGNIFHLTMKTYNMLAARVPPCTRWGLAPRWRPTAPTPSTPSRSHSVQYLSTSIYLQYLFVASIYSSIYL